MNEFDPRDEERYRGYFAETPVPAADAWRTANTARSRAGFLSRWSTTVALAATAAIGAVGIATYSVANHRFVPGSASPHANPSATIRPSSVVQTPTPGATAAATATVPGAASAAPGSTHPAATAAPSSRPDFPDASDTGVPAGTTLTASDSIIVTAPGTVINGLNVRGMIDIRADNVTIENTLIRADGYWGIRSTAGNTNLVVHNVEIAGDSSQCDGFKGDNAAFTEVHIHGCGNAFNITHDVSVADSYVHDLGSDPGNCVISFGSSITLRHNSFLAGSGEFALQLDNDSGSASNIVVDHNLIDGGGYNVLLGTVGGNRTITNNHFGRHHTYGVWDLHGQYTTTGNVWADNGQAVPGP